MRNSKKIEIMSHLLAKISKETKKIEATIEDDKEMAKINKTLGKTLEDLFSEDFPNKEEPQEE